MNSRSREVQGPLSKLVMCCWCGLAGEFFLFSNWDVGSGAAEPGSEIALRVDSGSRIPHGGCAGRVLSSGSSPVVVLEGGHEWLTVSGPKLWCSALAVPGLRTRDELFLWAGGLSCSVQCLGRPCLPVGCQPSLGAPLQDTFDVFRACCSH